MYIAKKDQTMRPKSATKSPAPRKEKSILDWMVKRVRPTKMIEVMAKASTTREERPRAAYEVVMMPTQAALQRVKSFRRDGAGGRGGRRVDDQRGVVRRRARRAEDAARWERGAGRGGATGRLAPRG